MHPKRPLIDTAQRAGATLIEKMNIFMYGPRSGKETGFLLVRNIVRTMKKFTRFKVTK